MMGLPIDTIFSPISFILMVKMVNKVIVMCAGLSPSPAYQGHVTHLRRLTNQWRTVNQLAPHWAPLLPTLCYLWSVPDEPKL